MPSYSDYAAIGSRTLMDQGAAKARGQEISGSMWGNTIATLGDVIPKQVRETMNHVAQRRAQQQMMQIFQDAGGDLEKALPQVMQIDPVFGNELAEKIAKSKKSAFEMRTAEWEFKKGQARWAKELLADANSQEEYTAGLMTMRDAGLPIDKYQTQWSQELKQQYLQGLLSYEKQLEMSRPKEPEPFTLSPGQQRFGGDGQPLASVPSNTPAATGGFSLSPGQTRFGPDGQPLASVPSNPSAASGGFTLSPGQTRYDDQGKPVASRPPTPPAPSAASNLDPTYANALDRAILMIPAVRRPAVVALANRLAESGNTEELKSVIRQAAVEGENVETQRQIEGRMNAAASLSDIEAMLKELQAMGVSTNIMRGTVEDMAARLGTSTDPKLRELGTRIADTFVEYRRSLTGVAFSQTEAAEYRRMFPNYSNTLPVNMAIISGLKRGMATRDREFWERKLGAEGARLVGAVQGESTGGGAAAPAGRGAMPGFSYDDYLRQRGGR